MKIRINDLARELEVKSKQVLEVLAQVGVTEKKTHSSSVEDDEAERVRKYFRERSGAANRQRDGGDNLRAYRFGVMREVGLVTRKRGSPPPRGS